MSNTNRALAALLLAGFLAAAAGLQAGEGKTASATARGTVTKVIVGGPTAKNNEVRGNFLVEGPPAPGVTYERAWVRVVLRTKLWKVVDGERKPAGLDDI